MCIYTVPAPCLRCVAVDVARGKEIQRCFGPLVDMLSLFSYDYSNSTLLGSRINNAYMLHFCILQSVICKLQQFSRRSVQKPYACQTLLHLLRLYRIQVAWKLHLSPAVDLAEGLSSNLSSDLRERTLPLLLLSRLQALLIFGEVCKQSVGTVSPSWQ